MAGSRSFMVQKKDYERLIEYLQKAGFILTGDCKSNQDKKRLFVRGTDVSLRPTEIVLDERSGEWLTAFDASVALMCSSGLGQPIEYDAASLRLYNRLRRRFRARYSRY